MRKLLLFIFLSLQLSALAQWEVVGSQLGTVANGAISDMLFHPESNALYLAYPDATEKKYMVQKREGDSWLPLGDAFGKTDISGKTRIAMAIHPETNEIYVAYPDYNFYAFIVQKYNEETAAWETIGSDLGNIDGVPGVDIAFHPQTKELHIVYPDPELDIFLVQKHNGTFWEQLGEPLGETSEDGNATIVFHPTTNDLYVGHVNYETLYVHVSKYLGEEWEQQGQGIHATHINGQIAIDFHSTTDLSYLGFTSLGGDSYSVQEFDGESWSSMNYFGGTSDYRTGIDLHFDAITERLYAAYLSYNKVEVQYYDGTEWTMLGESITDSGEDAGISIAMHPTSNEPYVLIRDNETNQYVVHRFNSGLSVSDVKNPVLGFFPNPTREMLYIELADLYKDLTVEIVNVEGSLVQTKFYEETSTIQSKIEGPAGIYFVKMHSNNTHLKTIKVLKK